MRRYGDKRVKPQLRRVENITVIVLVITALASLGLFAFIYGRYGYGHDGWGEFVGWYLLLFGMCCGPQYVVSVSLMCVFVRIGWTTPDEIRGFMRIWVPDNWLERNPQERAEDQNASDVDDG